MSIQLLDKTRKINRLLNDKHSSKVAFADICFVLGQMLLANAYIISSKGKLLGTYVNDDGMIPSFQSKRGSYIETMLNERFLNVLSTKENVNLETLGFSKEERQGVEALITPISIGGERLGTLFLCWCQKAFSLAKKIAGQMTEKLHCDGFNLVQNNGATAGQTVPHFHIHLIPRYENDGQTINWKQTSPTAEELAAVKEEILG